MSTLPVKTALLWIWGSTILFSGGVILALSLKKKWDSEVRNNPKFMVQSIIQKCDSVEALSTDYLAECLGLSLDSSYTLFKYSTDKLTATLEASPLIKKGDVSKIPPSTLLVEYTLRQPIAILQDYQNTVFDDEGVLFPLQPFRTPKLLPEVTLGENAEKKMPLAQELIAALKAESLSRPIKNVKAIDLSRIDVSKLSAREIVVVFNCESDKLVYLRLPILGWRECLHYFARIPAEYLKKGIVDMRLPQIAYISTDKTSEQHGVEK